MLSPILPELVCPSRELLPAANKKSGDFGRITIRSDIPVSSHTQFAKAGI